MSDQRTTLDNIISDHSTEKQHEEQSQAKQEKKEKIILDAPYKWS